MAQGWSAHELKKLRAKSLIALVNVFLAFEFKEYISADGVIELFIESGVLDKLSVSFVTNAFTRTAFGKTNVAKHSEGRKKSHYFLAATEKESVSLPDGRPCNFFFDLLVVCGCQEITCNVISCGCRLLICSLLTCWSIFFGFFF